MEKKFRYPGTRPFQENDRNLFFGRNTDIKNLTELIVLEKLVVLFSKSGYGKSSLLNAGVIPRLTEKEKFQVLSIRLNEQAKNPVDLMKYHLKGKANNTNFLASKFNIPSELPDDLIAILWFYCKSIQLSDKTSKALVLVFDQFEELFNFSNSEIEFFAGTLATLLNLNMPETVRKFLRKKLDSDKGHFTEEETDRLLEPLNLKVVFSLRNDRLSLLNQLKGSLPAVFKKTYELQPLDETEALEALLEPAEKEGDFASPMFTYSEDAISLILNSLKDKENKRIETFQLQLICQHAEELIIDKANANSKRLEITSSELGNPEDIFENHYNTIIGNLPQDSQHKARILIEDKLIIGGNRVPLPESVIIEEHQISADLLKTLVDKRLLRSEPNTVGGMSFELSHDTLVAPIQKTAKIRRLKEAEERVEKEQLEKAEIQRKLRRTRILLGTSGIALVIAVIAFFFAIEKSNEADKQEAISKALILAYGVNELLEEGKNLLALRTAESAFQTAKEAGALSSSIYWQAISNAFYYSESLQLVYFDGHQDAVNSVAFSPDGNFVLTGSYDKTAILWDTSGNLIRKFEVHADAVTSVAFSPDGNSILTGSFDSTAILWDIEGKLIQKFEGHQDALNSVAYSPDGNFVLTSSYDKTAILWDTKGNPLQKFEGHKEALSSVSFSPDGKSILTGSYDSTAILWDLEGKLIHQFKGHEGEVMSVVFSPDGKSLLTGSSDGTAVLWDLKGTPIKEFKGDMYYVNSVAFSKQGNFVLIGSLFGSAYLWDLGGKLIQKFGGYEESIYSVAFSPDGNSVLTGGNAAKLWDIQRKPIQKFEKHQKAVTSVAFSPDGNSVITGSWDYATILWDTLGNPIQIFEGHENPVFAVTYSPQGNSILTGSGDSTAILWDLDGNPITKFEGHHGEVHSVAFSPNGNSVLSGSVDSTAILWDLKGNQIQIFEGNLGIVNSVAFSPNGNYILTGSVDSTAILWDLNGNQTQKFKRHQGAVFSVAFSPGGDSVLTGSEDKTAILWDLKGNPIHIYKGHQEAVNSVAFAPNGKFVLTGGMDYLENNSSAILWDIEGKIIQRFGTLGVVSSVAFSPNGNSLLIGSENNTATLLKSPEGIFNWLQSPECPLRQLTEEEKVRYGIIEKKD